MKKIKLLTILLATLGYSFAYADNAVPLATIQAAQTGYSFGGTTNSWRAQSDGQSGASCTIEHNGTIISIRARLQPSPSVSGVPVIQRTAAIDPTVNNAFRGTWAIDNSNPNFIKNNYTPPTIAYTTISATVVSGGYYFPITVGTAPNTVTRNIVLYPNGFYVAKTPGSHLTARYAPGC